MLIDGSDAANLSGDMVQNFVCDHGANAELFGAVGGEAATEIMEAPTINTTYKIKAFFNLAEPRYCRCSIRGK